MRDIVAASVQFEHKDGDKAANLETISNFAAQAKAENVELLVFPECCITGYMFLLNLSREELTQLAEPLFAGPSCQELSALAVKNNMTIGAGLVEVDAEGKLYNTYVIALPNGEFQKHRKLHCFINAHMLSGSEITVFDMPQGCRVAVLTCYDLNIFENTRIAALRGAEILIAPHQTGGCLSPSPHCMGLVDKTLWENRYNDPDAIEAEFRGPKGREWLLNWLPSRAHDNGMFLIFSNSVGADGDEIRTGNAMILDCYGRIITETSKAADTMVVANLQASLRDMCTGVRWLKARRPHLYEELAIPTGNEQDVRVVRWEGVDLQK